MSESIDLEASNRREVRSDCFHHYFTAFDFIEALYKGAYAVAAVDHECGAKQCGFHDFDRSHDPKFNSKFSLILVLVFCFSWYHPNSLDILCSIVVFDSS